MVAVPAARPVGKGQSFRREDMVIVRDSRGSTSRRGVRKGVAATEHVCASMRKRCYSAVGEMRPAGGGGEAAPVVQ